MNQLDQVNQSNIGVIPTATTTNNNTTNNLNQPEQNNNNQPNDLQTLLQNITIIGLQKLSSQQIGIISEKQIISLNIKTFKIDHKIKPGRNVACITILNPTSPQQNNKQTEQNNNPIQQNQSNMTQQQNKIIKQGKSLQFFTGHQDGTLIMWNYTNNKFKQMKIFSDIDINNRTPVNCINIIKYTQNNPIHHHNHHNNHNNNHHSMIQRHQHNFNESIRRYKKENNYLKQLLLSGHQNGIVKQWNISTGQCVKEIEMKSNCILLFANHSTNLNNQSSNTNVQQQQQQQTLSQSNIITRDEQVNLIQEDDEIIIQPKEIIIQKPKQKVFQVIHKGALAKHKDHSYNPFKKQMSFEQEQFMFENKSQDNQMNYMMQFNEKHSEKNNNHQKIMKEQFESHHHHNNNNIKPNFNSNHHNHNNNNNHNQKTTNNSNLFQPK